MCISPNTHRAEIKGTLDSVTREPRHEIHRGRISREGETSPGLSLLLSAVRKLLRRRGRAPTAGLPMNCFVPRATEAAQPAS